ncbi:MAG: hypothetical protein O3A63_17255 [Proteobacteria bacterium]|nr:hypothetical protein [Pseudomonadota bacterium]
MNVEDLITRIISGAVSPLPCEDEGAWYAEWAGHNLHLLDPLTMAAWGGAMSDRLAWVFVSGYQAAIRSSCSIQNAPGWLALLVSEDRKKGEFPPVTIGHNDHGSVMNGVKTWVAACEHVDELLVKVGNGASRKLVAVPATAQGVGLEARPDPIFLPELSQGQATFQDVNLPRAWQRDPQALDGFGPSEALHVTVALTGFMLSHVCRFHVKDSGEQGTRGMIRTLAALLVEISEPAEMSNTHISSVLARIDAGLKPIADRFAALLDNNDSDAALRYRRDAHLVSMYSSSIQARSAAA